MKELNKWPKSFSLNYLFKLTTASSTTQRRKLVGTQLISEAYLVVHAQHLLYFEEHNVYIMFMYW